MEPRTQNRGYAAWCREAKVPCSHLLAFRRLSESSGMRHSATSEEVWRSCRFDGCLLVCCSLRR